MALTSVKSSIKDLLFQIAGEDKKDFVLINLAWKRIVGKIIADKSFVLSQKEDVLFIGVKNNIWMQELVLQKDFLLQELNKVISNNKIKQIIFTLKSRKSK